MGDVLFSISAALAEGFANAFWSIVTSLPVLTALAVIVIAGFIARLLPEQIIPEPFRGYIALARFAGRAALLAIVFLIGFRIADERTTLRDVRAELRTSQFQLANVTQSERDKAELSAAAQARAAELEKQVADYVAKVEAVPAADVCRATDADVDFVHRRRGRKAKAKVSVIDRLRGAGD